MHVLRDAQEDGRGCDAVFAMAAKLNSSISATLVMVPLSTIMGRLLLGEQDHSAVTIRPAARRRAFYARPEISLR